MKIVHVTEAFEGGVIEFLRSLTNATPDIEYTIIYGRHHFYEAVKNRLHNSSNIGCEFSGGLDSSGIGAIAQHILKPQQFRIFF